MALGEAEIIAIIREMAGPPTPGVDVWIGDDAAAFRFAESQVLLTTDSMYEGVHFTLETYGYSDVGWKAAAAGMSDIAAMGGQPCCLLLSLAFGEAPGEDEVRSLVGGLVEASSPYNCALIGGDVCRSGNGLALTVTVAGTPPPGGPVLRSTARIGDVVAVTGTPGDSAAGLYVLQSGNDGLKSRFPRLMEAHLRPRPRVPSGSVLAAHGVSAMEDVSDGLAADLGHICQESGLGCRLEEESLPISEDALLLAGECGLDPALWSLAGGEDYELVFTVDPLAFEGAAAALARLGVSVSRIGSMRPPGEGCLFMRRGGEAVALEGMGYEHFI